MIKKFAESNLIKSLFLQPNLPWGDRIGFQYRIMAIIVVLVVFILSLQGMTTYYTSKNLLQRYNDEMLKSSVKNMAEKIDLYSSVVDSREITRKTEYLMTNELATFNAQKIPVQIYILDHQGAIVLSTSKDNSTQLSKETLQKILNSRNGLQGIQISGDMFRLAYQQIPGRNWTCLIKLAEADYLKPVIYLRNMVTGLGLVAMLVAVVCCIWLAGKFSGPLNDLCAVMAGASMGNLTVRAKERGVGREFSLLGQSFNNMLAKLGEMIDQFKETGSGLLTTSQKMQLVSKNQLDNVAATESSAIAINGVMKSVAGLVDLAEKASREMMLASEEGMAALKTVVSRIEENMKNTARGTATMQQLDKNIQEINNMLNVIKEVSEQTRLLSLNASIEAARAGELGQGFAVVAGEVRRLADDTATSTKNMTIIASAIEGQSMVVQEQVKIADEMVKEGSAASEKAQEALARVFDRITATDRYIMDISQQIREVAGGVDQMAVTIQHIAGDIEQHDDFDQSECFSALEISNLAQHLADMALKIQDHLNEFNSTQESE
ncbi:methyl-accepting chemotaxis protein [Desulfotomaculum arcticum]|uniref:Methyl-accepting chemotaxis protein n=1 Tax=Desulfotruncus arcticus DSM 17038 TaxID=1121424 RepID=A0A1I2V5G6_9FIRM|nr:methyl-accepting chemotaxis protein [Desulfotruncus arcticus]SFG82546.1 methyl-accepting chemotaxis protein [Desulfotomaculum arcticum] [Desulfotruncus arcticus DSM 17038]